MFLFLCYELLCLRCMQLTVASTAGMIIQLFIQRCPVDGCVNCSAISITPVLFLSTLGDQLRERSSLRSTSSAYIAVTACQVKHVIDQVQ